MGRGSLKSSLRDWEANSGYNHNSFTEQLLLLIEDTLKGDVE